ncbi:MAG: helix-turn-helix domain-containing protein [Minwuia sp.]|nr:helix-turn-helix domain-containing protein [Minwuia sp.]
MLGGDAASSGADLSPQGRRGFAPEALFDVGGLVPQDQFGVWKESIAVIFDVDAPRNDWRDGFGARIHATMLGPMMLARCQTQAQIFTRGAGRISQDGLDHYMIQFYETGAQRVVSGSREIDHPASTMLVYDLAREMRATADTFSNLSLIIPRELLSERLIAPDDQHMRHFTCQQPTVAILWDFLRGAMVHAGNMSLSEAENLGVAALTLIAACLNAAHDENLSHEQVRNLARMTAVRRMIQTHLADPDLTPEWLAAEAGMSRTVLYRMFEPMGGIAGYIRETRLRRALQHLLSPQHQQRSLLEIALMHGYGSDTAFGRAFKKRFGITPRDVRDGQLPFPERAAMAGHDRLDRQYEGWLTYLAS